MTDVMKHKLTGVQLVDGNRLAAIIDREDHRKWLHRNMGADAGRLIAERWPPTVETDDEGNERHTLTVYAFSPEELAALVANVREQAMQEFLAVADGLTEEQENDNEQ